MEPLKSQNEAHLRVELAKTSSKSLFLRRLANQRLRYGPRRHFLFWLHVPVLFRKIAATSRRPVVPLTPHELLIRCCGCPRTLRYRVLARAYPLVARMPVP